MQRDYSRRFNVIARWLVGFSAVGLAFAPPLVRQPVYAAHEEVYQYRQITGNTSKDLEWHLTEADRYRLVCSSPNARNVTITDGDYDTRCWHKTSADGKTRLKAERIGQTIAIRGRFEGNSIEKILHIDDCPWYQATSLSLREFVASTDTERLFWIIRPTTLTVHKIKAIKKGVEQIAATDHLLRIRLTLTGLLAPFWKSDYWFALPEGVFFRFQGPSGPPGSPLTTITRMAG